MQMFLEGNNSKAASLSTGIACRKHPKVQIFSMSLGYQA